MLVLLLLASLAAPIALADDEVARAEAKRLKDEATAAFDRGDAATALTLFRKAHERFPSPRLLYNIGRTAERLGRTAEALAAYRQFRDSGVEAPAEVKRLAEEAIARLEHQLEPAPTPAPVAGPRALPAPAPAQAVAAPARRPPSTPLVRRWWLWTTVALVAAGVATGVALGVTLGGGSDEPTVPLPLAR
jgi:tetratricopeptide (TPR) repeat protein